MKDLHLEQADDDFGKRGVVRISSVTNRAMVTCCRQALGEPETQSLHVLIDSAVRLRRRFALHLYPQVRRAGHAMIRARLDRPWHGGRPHVGHVGASALGQPRSPFPRNASTRQWAAQHSSSRLSAPSPCCRYPRRRITPTLYADAHWHPRAPGFPLPTAPTGMLGHRRALAYALIPLTAF